jgi:eukaryotic-like serine/threonine-protein kinase
MFSAGSVVAGYRVERPLGEGGMGAVYLAQNPTLPRLDAVKVLSAELSRNPEFRARFVREADVASGLSHPNIVSIYRRGETDDGQLWIAMQYVAGTDADAAVRAGQMPPGRAAFVISEVAKALDYAHARNVVHRDVKPANFLLSTEGGVERVLLGDFGIARALDDVGLTMTGAVLATVAYAAPEVLSGMPFDGRADLYSLGCTLFGLLTGRAPFADSNGVPAVMMAHLEAPPPRVSDRVPGMPPAMDWVIATAMAKDPALRFQSGADLAAAASAALAGRNPAAVLRGPVAAQQWWQPGEAPRTAMAPSIQPKPAPRKRTRLLIGALAAVALLAVAGTVTAVVATRDDGGTAPAAAPTTSAPPPVPLTDLKSLLLSNAEVDKVMGVPMQQVTESNHMGTDGKALGEQDCVGAFAPGQQIAYSGTGYISTAQLGYVSPGATVSGLLFQTFQAVVGFPTADGPAKYYDKQIAEWQQCANRTLTFSPNGQVVKIVNGTVTDTGNRMITITQTLEGAQNWTCARALAPRNNISIDTFACSANDSVAQVVAVTNDIAKKVAGA